MKHLKKYLTAITLFSSLLSTPVLADTNKVDKEIEGTWQVTSIDGYETITRDIWQFKDNNFYQSVANQSLETEEYQIQNSAIQLDKAELKIEASDKNSMTIKVERYTFELKRVNTLSHLYAATGCY